MEGADFSDVRHLHDHHRQHGGQRRFPDAAARIRRQCPIHSGCSASMCWHWASPRPSQVFWEIVSAPSASIYLGLFFLLLAHCCAALRPPSSLLIVARLVQGVGGGLAQPLGPAMLYRAFPASEIGTAPRVSSALRWSLRRRSAPSSAACWSMPICGASSSSSMCPSASSA